MKRHIFMCILAITCFCHHEAAAFWGSTSTDTASGLNVAAGFDVNTITTATGTVLTLPGRKTQEEHTVMSVATLRGTMTVVLGPWWYWEKQRISLPVNQEVSITGSLAQGKDGSLYLFAQRLENRSSGEIVTLRSESGKPLWSQGSSGNPGGSRLNGGGGSGAGAGNRGSGMRGGRR